LPSLSTPCGTNTVSCVTQVPDFSKIKDIKSKKKAFFDFLYPMVMASNLQLLKIRETVKQLLKKKDAKLTPDERDWLMLVAEHFNVKALTLTEIREKSAILLRRIHVIPPSIALAQAANESAWGSSRFARQGNNLFGQWCFSKGCGLKPKQRNAEATHEVRKFKQVNDSVHAYIINLNRHQAYHNLRKIRELKIRRGEKVLGLSLTQGLLSYSERGEEYINELQSMIKTNKLDLYDNQFWSEIGYENERRTVAL
jgi:Bax protein